MLESLGTGLILLGVFVVLAIAGTLVWQLVKLWWSSRGDDQRSPAERRQDETEDTLSST